MNNHTQNTTVPDTIRQLEKAETVAMLDDDYSTLDNIWHPEFTVNTPLNPILKTADIQGAMKAGLIKYSLRERNIEDILVHDNVVVTLGNEVTVPIDNAPMAGQKTIRRYTNIWVMENNEWKLFSRHASNICNEEK
jgi:hypothetical protein